MNVLILGGDGYLGWPTAMYLSSRGHRVGVLDNFAKRRWELELNVEPLLPILTLHDRVKAWREATDRALDLFVADLRNYGAVKEFQAGSDRSLWRAAVGALLHDGPQSRRVHPNQQHRGYP